MTIDNTLRPYGYRTSSLRLEQKAIEQPEREKDSDGTYESDFTGLTAEEAKIRNADSGAKVDEHLDANGSSAHHQQSGGQWWKDSPEQSNVHQHDPGDLVHGEESPWGSSKGGLRHSHSHDVGHGRPAPINIRPDDPSVTRGSMNNASPAHIALARSLSIVRKFTTGPAAIALCPCEDEHEDNLRKDAPNVFRDDSPYAGRGGGTRTAQPQARPGFSLRPRQPQQAPERSTGGYEFNPSSNRFGQARVSPGGSQAGQPRGGSPQPKRTISYARKGTMRKR